MSNVLSMSDYLERHGKSELSRHNAVVYERGIEITHMDSNISLWFHTLELESLIDVLILSYDKIMEMENLRD
jgi:hypothetical protein|tara:strand:+ start:6699 stop:6914 length:216 start_codon:yes stop_codon:yes gene_type:complete